MVEWSTACPDWSRRIVAKESLIPFAALFPTEAEAALEVFRQLQVVDAAGQPTMGEVCRPWALDFVASIFGAYDPESGRRLVTEWLASVAKKNTKSTLAAGIMLTALVRNWRHSAELLILAPTIEIANNSFYPARDMVRAHPVLNDLMQVQDHYRTITHRTTGAFLKVVAAEAETVGGKKASAVLVDELWLFGSKPGAENMLREATGGLASRPEGFVIYLTTQSDQPPAGVFRQKLSYARGVRDGRIKDKRFCPVLYEFPPEMIEAGGHLDPANFYITNPNLGASVDREYLEREFAKAQESGPESLAGFVAKHLNVEVGLSLMSDRWAGADYWQQQTRPGLTLDDILERSEVIEIGVDGGGLDDLLGLAIIGRDKETRDWLVWNHAWAHPSVLERRKTEAPRLRDFERQGDLTIISGLPADVTELADYCERIWDSGLLDKIGVDPVAIGVVIDELEARGIPKERIFSVPQGWRLTRPIKTCERKLAEGSMWHGGQDLMAWCVGNARVEPRGNAVMITKQTSGKSKIDPLMALFNAAELLGLNPPAAAPDYQLFVIGGDVRRAEARA